MKKVVYMADGRLHIVNPHPKYDVDQVALKDVPYNVPFKILDASEFPESRELRDAWEVDMSNPDGVGMGPHRYMIAALEEAIMEQEEIQLPDPPKAVKAPALGQMMEQLGELAKPNLPTLAKVRFSKDQSRSEREAIVARMKEEHEKICADEKARVRKLIDSHMKHAQTHAEAVNAKAKQEWEKTCAQIKHQRDANIADCKKQIAALRADMEKRGL